jgi:hypothetical protein
MSKREYDNFSQTKRFEMLPDPMKLMTFLYFAGRRGASYPTITDFVPLELILLASVIYECESKGKIRKQARLRGGYFTEVFVLTDAGRREAEAMLAA